MGEFQHCGQRPLRPYKTRHFATLLPAPARRAHRNERCEKIRLRHLPNRHALPTRRRALRHSPHAQRLRQPSAARTGYGAGGSAHRRGQNRPRRMVVPLPRAGHGVLGRCPRRPQRYYARQLLAARQQRHHPHLRARGHAARDARRAPLRPHSAAIRCERGDQKR